MHRKDPTSERAFVHLCRGHRTTARSLDSQSVSTATPHLPFFSLLHALLCLIRRQFYCRGRDRLYRSGYTLFCALVLPTVKRIVHTADRFLHGSLSASLACACFLETYQPDCGSAVHYVYISSHSMQKTAEEHAVNLHRIVYFRALFWTWTLKH